MATKIISASTTIRWGILVTFILMAMFAATVIILPSAFSVGTNICICLIFPSLVFISGFSTIQPTQAGLLEILGTRQETTITEGIVWLPPFTSVTIFDTKEQARDLEEFEIMSVNQISIKVRISYNWRIVDNYKVSLRDINVIDGGLSKLVSSELRSEMLEKKLNDINLINSDKNFNRSIIKACNETAEDKWGIQITELFISAVKPATSSRMAHYESKDKCDEIIVEYAVGNVKNLGITPREALDKYARERENVPSIEYLHHSAQISEMIDRIEKLLKK
jgi:regulator of protease activity HflC (stomatin/prohibitin superfamily)